MSTSMSLDTLARLAQGKTFLDLKDKVVLITGAGSGIGLATALAFAANGAQVALLDINAANLEAARGQILEVAPQAVASTWLAGVNDEAAVQAAIDGIVGRHGQLDVLINNAGISMNMPTLELSGENWRKAMDINVNGVFYCAQAAGRRMLEQGSGTILNLSSMYGVVAAPNRAAYCTSKAAVAMLTKVLAIEWAASGLRVNAIAPGYIKTALVEELCKAGRMDLEALSKRTPMGRIGEPHEIAALALFLASDQSSFINGQVIVADGGWSSYSYI